MIRSSRPDALISQVEKISRCERWLLYRRLEELMIPCWCPDDGSLWVEIEHGIDAILLHSTVYQVSASRQELVDWLSRCWEAADILSTQFYNS
ncbi:Asr1405/Asl0597 family protein [Cyanobacterium sp. uoEpiScrs1]|uniref:Asr1405/Asl0597 family protein n=1 Tax=Cyanobacterium sp. uoEpiScrs1 TaxID=2976343 RepID=UPI00226AF295|nr:Asr1405/Asl0597 family protein [Cyanobacterium sp. uoEpiScrs1]